jgi:lysozyme
MAGLPGVDVASYQGPPGTWASRAGAISWAAVKFTELEPGGYEYTDPDAAADWAWLGANGKLRVAYLFGHPSVSAAGQVNLLAEALDHVGGLGAGDGVALDFEVTDGLPAAEVAAWARDLLALMATEFGRAPVVYTYLDFAYSGCCDGLSGYLLWIADPNHPPGQPAVPGPWSSWAIHQYSITGEIDRDLTAWTSQAEMAAAVGKTAPAPAPAAAMREDDAMRISLLPGAREVFAPWPEAPDGAAPYSNVSMVLTGETGAVVSVEFWRGSPQPAATQVHELTSGAALPVAPVHKWPGVTAVSLTRTDSSVTAAAAAVISRW